jgi:hypothetical protein
VIKIRTLAAVAMAASIAVTSLSALAQEPAAAQPEVKLSLSNKWRLECSGGADSDGNVVLRVTPKGGTPVDATVAIVKGRSENMVAQDIRNALKTTLDQKVFKVEVDDGEDVLVKRRKGPDFELKLVESTVQGMRFNVEKE